MRGKERTPRFASLLLASPSVSSFGSAAVNERTAAYELESDKPPGKLFFLQRTAQGRRQPRYSVVMNQQRAEPLQRREALELDELVVAQVDTVELVLFIVMKPVLSATLVSMESTHCARACVTARLSTLLSLWPARTASWRREHCLGLMYSSVCAATAAVREPST